MSEVERANEVRDQHFQALLGDISATNISQGAEALVFIADRHPYLDDRGKCIIKYRPKKTYRHPVLDARLNKQRTLAEARTIRKVHSIGVAAPKLIFVDPQNGLIWMELVKGKSLKQWIWDTEKEEPDSDKKVNEALYEAGATIGKLHYNDIIHGDLTSSNIMLDQKTRPVMIDFGLAGQSALIEDKAVDLYVLERAVDSTHPVNAKRYNQELLNGYSAYYQTKSDGNKKLKDVLARLEQVQQRGRKRSMVG